MKLNKSQSIYVLYNPVLNITKIGISENINKRKRDLECACGCELELHYNTTHILNAITFESLCHSKLAEKRRIGEWFDVSPEEATTVVQTIIETAVIDPIVTAYGEGVSISKIANTHGVTRQAIIAKLIDYGYREPHDSLKGKELPTGWVKYGSYIPTSLTTKIKPHKSELPSASHAPITFLDDEIPVMPISKMKRLEHNINYNGEWYQVSIYKNGAFTYAYSRDIDKARLFANSLACTPNLK